MLTYFRLAWDSMRWVIPVALTVLLTISGVIYSVYYEGFEGIIPRMGDDEEEVILSDILTPTSSSEERPRIEVPTISPPPAVDGSDSGELKRDFYVFALDVSGSVGTRRVTEDQLQLFMSFHERFRPDATESEKRLCKVSGTGENGNVTEWDLARSKMCHLLRYVDDDAMVALWRFGATPHRVGTERRYDFLVEGNRQDAQSAVMGIERSSSEREFLLTSFPKLLEDWHQSYVNQADYNSDEIRWIDDMHFIIVSDFVQDEGEGESVDLWEFSASAIRREVARLNSRRKVVFHLIPNSRGNANSTRSVIPLLQNSLEWYKFDQIPLLAPESSVHAKVFNTFEQSSQTIRFYFPIGGSSPNAKRLVMAEGWRNAELEIRLIRDRYSTADNGMKLRLNQCEEADECPSFEPHRLMEIGAEVIGQGGAVRVDIDHPSSFLCIEPLTVPASLQSGYRLAISKKSHLEKSEQQRVPGDQVTYVVPVEFSPYVPEGVARLWWWMWAIALVFLPLLYVAFVVGHWFRRRWMAFGRSGSDGKQRWIATFSVWRELPTATIHPSVTPSRSRG